MILISWIIWLINLPFRAILVLYQKIISRQKNTYKTRAAQSGMKEPSLRLQDHINEIHQIVAKLSVVEVKVKTLDGEAKLDEDDIFKDTNIACLAREIDTALMIAVNYNIRIPGAYAFAVEDIDKAIDEFLSGYGALVKFFASENGKKIKAIVIEKIKNIRNVSAMSTS